MARCRILLALELQVWEPEVATAEARTALSSFEVLGAAPDADSTSAFLRSMGVKAACSGPRSTGVPTRREMEILQLLGEGATNRQIADRLILSPKTVEHHVRAVLAKLELTSRAEAAVYAVRHAGEQSARN